MSVSLDFVQTILTTCVLMMFSPGVPAVSGQEFDTADPPPSVRFVMVSGQVIDRDTRRPLPNAVVRIGTDEFPVDDLGKFRIRCPATVQKSIVITAAGYKPCRENIPGDASCNLRQIGLEPRFSWDFPTIRLRGWHDWDGMFFHREKFIAYCRDVASHGANCIVIVPHRSWGRAGAGRRCDGRRGEGWWAHMLEEGYGQTQFGRYSAVYQDIGNRYAPNPGWVDHVADCVTIARDQGLWVVLVLWCPNDTKWYGNDWWLPGKCSKSPYTDSVRAYTRKQLRALDALLPALADAPNLILSDNWETTGRKGSVTLRWKKQIYQRVRHHLPDVPYFVFVDDKHADEPEIVRWINTTPGITGYHSHYIVGDSRADLGVSPSKRLLCTEERDLTLDGILPAFRWADREEADVCPFITEYRNFMRLDGGKDAQAGKRDRLYSGIDGYFSRD